MQCAPAPRRIPYSCPCCTLGGRYKGSLGDCGEVLGLTPTHFPDSACCQGTSAYTAPGRAAGTRQQSRDQVAAPQGGGVARVLGGHPFPGHAELGALLFPLPAGQPLSPCSALWLLLPGPHCPRWCCMYCEGGEWEPAPKPPCSLPQQGLWRLLAVRKFWGRLQEGKQLSTAREGITPNIPVARTRLPPVSLAPCSRQAPCSGKEEPESEGACLIRQ